MASAMREQPRGLVIPALTAVLAVVGTGCVAGGQEQLGLGNPDDAVRKGLRYCLERAQRALKNGRDIELAQSIQGAAVLENRSPSQVQTITVGAAQLASGACGQAQETFRSANEGLTGRAVSKVARTAVALAHRRHAAALRTEYAEAARDEDVLRQADVVLRILAIEPTDRAARRARRKLLSKVRRARLSAARQQKAKGKLGVAYQHVMRLLAFKADDRAALTERADLTIDHEVMVAEAYAGARVRTPRNLDPDRSRPIEAYLAERLR